jgi:Porin PorA
MRRAAGLTLTALGAFLVTLAALLRLWVPGQVIKFPLNEYSVTTLTGTGLTYFNSSSLQDFRDTRATEIITIEGNVSAGSPSTAVWSSFTALDDETRKTLISRQSRVVAFDRRTGALLNCCGASVGTSSQVRQSGLGYRFPFSTRQQTYQVYDVTLRRPVPFRFTGTATIDGIAVDKFTDQITRVKVGQQTLPAQLAGLPNQGDITLPEYLTETTTYWVDPVTGIPVNMVLRQRTDLESASGTPRLVLLAGTLAETPRSVRAAVTEANKAHPLITWVQDLGPLIGLAGGGLALLLGIVLLWRSVKPYEPAYDDDMIDA